MKTIVAGALYANIDCEANFPRKVSCSIKKIKRKQTVEIKTSKTWCEEVNSQYLTPFLTQDDETEVETKIELNLGFVKVSRIVKTKKSKEDKS